MEAARPTAITRPAGDTAPRGPARRARGWRYSAAGKRDLRLDFLRGYAVFAMVTDHVAGASWLYNISGGNRFFVTAAEGFVFISGVVVGIVYGGIARAQGFRAATNKLLQRAWLLYVLAVWLTIGFAIVATIAGNPLGAPFAASPARFLFEVITLRRTFYLVDVLLLYLFAMLAAIGALAALRRGWWWLVALVSVALWGAYQANPEVMRLPWPIHTNPVFNFAPWQLLFFTGMILGYYRRWLAERVAARFPASPLRDGYVIPLALAVAALVWLSATDAALFDRFAPNGDAGASLDRWFDKSALPLPRLAACAVVFAFAWALVTRCWRPLRALFGPFLLVLGQGALYAYAVHIFLAALVYYAAVQVWGPGPDGGFPRLHPGVNTAFQVVALAVLWALTRVQFLQDLFAPLGRPPFIRGRLRIGGRRLWRPNDSLTALLLAATIAAGALPPRDSASAPSPGAIPDTPRAIGRLIR